MSQYDGLRQLSPDGGMLLHFLPVRFPCRLFRRRFIGSGWFDSKLTLDISERDCGGKGSNGFSGPRDGHTDRYQSYQCAAANKYVHTRSKTIRAHPQQKRSYAPHAWESDAWTCVVDWDTRIESRQFLPLRSCTSHCTLPLVILRRVPDGG